MKAGDVYWIDAKYLDPFRRELRWCYRGAGSASNIIRITTNITPSIVRNTRRLVGMPHNGASCRPAWTRKNRRIYPESSTEVNREGDFSLEGGDAPRGCDVQSL